jgi:hypothetical protein
LINQIIESHFRGRTKAKRTIDYTIRTKNFPILSAFKPKNIFVQKIYRILWLKAI